MSKPTKPYKLCIALSFLIHRAHLDSVGFSVFPELGCAAGLVFSFATRGMSVHPAAPL